MSIDNAHKTIKFSRFFNRWTVTVASLVVIIIAGGVIIWTGYGQKQDLVIILEPEEISCGYISVSGDVNNPGLYPIRTGDTVDDILKAAGGLTGNADPDRLELTVTGKGEAKSPQKVDINRAEAWLLAALPGIGDARAQSIIEYRRQHGLFRDINEILKVPGMGDAVFDGIKNLITVND